MTGLDSATTFNICETFRTVSKSLNRCFIMSLLQPSPQVLSLFNSVILLSKGYIVYHGPRRFVSKYFKQLGFTCPAKTPWAEFLQEVCTPSGGKFLEDERAQALTADEFVLRFRESAIFSNTSKELKKSVHKYRSVTTFIDIEYYVLFSFPFVLFCFITPHNSLFVYFVVLIHIYFQPLEKRAYPRVRQHP